MTIRTASWYTAHFDAGLLLVGQDYEGELQWNGTPQQWQRCEMILEKNWKTN